MTTIANRYEIEDLIARGGMGSVYKGRDLTTGLPIAIKWLKTELIANNPQVVERFHREGDILRELSHPNIVKVYSTIQDQGNHYIVMEYLSGGTLQKLIEVGSPLPVDFALQIALDIADALTRTHRLNIVHRDIKPSNVLMAPDGTPRLSDFGIARNVQQNTANLTTTGAVMGTYAYMSPEGIMGEALDHRADIWSFGVMLYEMLTGTRPFKASQDTAILVAILNEPHPDIRLARPDIPPELADLIDRMLIKDPKERISSVRQVGTRIEGILNWMFEGTQSGIRSRFEPGDDDSNDSMDSIDIEIVTIDPPATPATPPLNPNNTPSVITNSSKSLNRLLGGLLGLAALVTIIGGIFLALSPSPTDEPVTGNDAISIVTNRSTSEIAVIVARIEPVGDVTQRDVSRFIVEDLRNKLELEATFSEIRIYQYPEIVKTAEEAQRIAEVNQAPIIVWGTYDNEQVTLNIQIGDYDDVYPDSPIDRSDIEQAANVRMAMTNERQQSIAFNVLASIITIQAAYFDVDATTNFALLQDMTYTPADILGETAAAGYHRATMLIFEDTQRALEVFSVARDTRAANNPLFYYFSGFMHTRLGNAEDALNDASTARRLANNPRWTGPLYVEALAQDPTNYQAILDITLQIIDIRPDDWFAWNYAGAMYFYLGDYDQAERYYAEAFRLGNENVYPYPYLILIESRSGNLMEAQRLTNELLQEYPDPFFGYKAGIAAFGNNPDRLNPIPQMYLALGYFVLGQYADAIAAADEAIAVDPDIPEHWQIKGFSHCAIGELDAALEAYNQAIMIDNQSPYLYFLRADTYYQLGDLEATADDVGRVQEFDGVEQLLPLIEAGYRGEVTCRDGLNLIFE